MELKYDEYPKACPPLNAIETEGIYYRYCDTFPPTAVDFETHFDQDKIVNGDICGSMALSFFNNTRSLKNLRKKFPRKFKTKYIVKFNIKKDLGLTLLEGTHLNLWEYNKVKWLERDDLFLEEVQSESYTK